MLDLSSSIFSIADSAWSLVFKRYLLYPMLLSRQSYTSAMALPSSSILVRSFISLQNSSKLGETLESIENSSLVFIIWKILSPRLPAIFSTRAILPSPIALLGTLTIRFKRTLSSWLQMTAR